VYIQSKSLECNSARVFNVGMVPILKRPILCTFLALVSSNAATVLL
jgi:hypothetical protein